MALVIAGMSQKEVLEHLGISRTALYRYRKDPKWPGDRADIEVIEAFHELNRRDGGRPKDEDPQPDLPLNEVTEQVNRVKELSLEEKLTKIEMQKARIKEYQLNAMREYRRRIQKGVKRLLDEVIEVLAGLQLDQAAAQKIQQRFQDLELQVDELEDPAE